MNNKLRLCILRNELDDDHLLWVKACDDYSDKVDYHVFNLTSNNWLEELTEKKYDLLLAKPPGLTAPFKQLYDERIFVIDSALKLPIYPSPIEIYIYENKRLLYSWLKANNLPHPETNIFYSKHEADIYIEQSYYPVVAKTNIGASGSGVKILKNKAEAKIYLKKSFLSNGAPKRWGPNLTKGNLLKRGLHYIVHPADINKKLVKYKAKKNDAQKDFVIFQEFIPHDFEWRVVAIGDSYFAHKKLKIGDKASGSTLKKYDNPPIYLFDFAKKIMEEFNFYSQAIDLFETKNDGLLINEMQCIFGQSDPYQMLVDDKAGRYRFVNGNWKFEEGDFNQNESYNLRLRHILTLQDIK